MKPEIDKAVSNILDRNNIKIEAVFVPQRFSRNKNSKHKSINYNVKVTCNMLKLEFEYSYGTGCLCVSDKIGKLYAPEYLIREPLVKARLRGISTYTDYEFKNSIIESICEIGSWEAYKVCPDKNEMFLSMLDNGEMAHNSATFEMFCNDFGYDTDSRNAEKIYNKMLSYYSFTSNVLSDNEYEELLGIIREG